MGRTAIGAIAALGVNEVCRAPEVLSAILPHHGARFLRENGWHGFHVLGSVFLVLTGAGRGFCSGQNLKASEALGSDIAAGVMRHYWPAFAALRECRVPVVVAVNGVTQTGGHVIDISTASPMAKNVKWKSG